jgi:hypothetical protein
MSMVQIHSQLNQPVVFNSFFGKFTLEPGLNADFPDKVWKNLKRNNPDIQSLVEQGIVCEVPEDESALNG